MKSGHLCRSSETATNALPYLHPNADEGFRRESILDHGARRLAPSRESAEFHTDAVVNADDIAIAKTSRLEPTNSFVHAIGNRKLHGYYANLDNDTPSYRFYCASGF
ncbi:MAG: hypothetical protein R3A47_04745 [Polyangiales bacterium]